MKVSSASPGKYYERRKEGEPTKSYLVLAVHRAGQQQESLQRLETVVSAGLALVAEMIDNSQDKLGEQELIPLDVLDGQTGMWYPISKRGARIRFVPGTAESSAERSSKSKSRLKLHGGARKAFNLTAESVEALNKIRAARQAATGETLDDTKIVIALLIEESQRLQAANK